ncbi:unnamed protein product [Lymnaea stagnalis]|uniref:Thioredoxin domain-containing protein n=1 Tax=Lymnaea stagnalis TaxID=6523 RepID=A0AAV2GXB7_LYMST
MSLSTIYDILGIIADFDENFCASDDNSKKIIIEHLQKMDKINFKIPDFPASSADNPGTGLEWLNVSQPLKLYDHLKGNIVVLDFFTYCCINCMHILPDLEVVEQQFPYQSGVVVIGVHSAKFLNEKLTANILSAILRYNITHPVVNDKDATLWQALAVSCWPTLVFLGPSGQIIYSLAGEGHRSKVLKFLRVATEFYSPLLQPCILPLSLEKDKTPRSNLSFPGKVFYWQDKDWLVISDTGNNRILVTDRAGVVQAVVGNSHRGLQDGNFESAEFSSPQGISCDAQYIYVADTGNHCLRRLAFDDAGVKTLSGTGQQGIDKEGGKLCRAQELSSPWDVLVAKTPNDSSPVMFIAMAGTHQIWVYFLTDSLWYHGRKFEAGTCIRFAGTGLEENRNNSYPEKASFAQPSGLAFSMKDDNFKLYIADSESSSVRFISLSDGKVSGLVGGERDPTNLFAYGDVDGKGVDAKLQHPLGVAVLEDKLIIADSYNHKIKVVDLNSSVCQTLAGTGHPGSKLNTDDLCACEFNEPGGVTVNTVDQLIYVADTNNHSIKVIDLDKKKIFQLPIVFPEANEMGSVLSSKESDTSTSDLTLLPDQVVPKDSSSVTLTVSFKLLEGEHINTEAPNTWRVIGLDEVSQELLNKLSAGDTKGKLQFLSADADPLRVQANITLRLPVNVTTGLYPLKITSQLFVCQDKTNACLPPRQTHFKQVLIFI